MGAGSGVGMMAVQLAKLAGARVITTVGSDDKIPKAVILGADAVINHAKEKVSERVKLLTEGRGVDVVVEHIGPEVWDSCLESLSKGGRLGTRAELMKASELMGQKRMIAVLDRTFPLEDARAAQELMSSRRFFGKIVLVC
jgi:NADPH:quinone reductase-like Zn-dependent oxidoreductase